MSLKDDIFAAVDMGTVRVEVPEWNTHVNICGVSAKQREVWEQSLGRDNGSPQIIGARSRFLVQCIVDDEGNRVFDDDDADRLSEKSSAIIDRLWDAANEVNAVTAQAVEEMSGN